VNKFFTLFYYVSFVKPSLILTNEGRFSMFYNPTHFLSLSLSIYIYIYLLWHPEHGIAVYCLSLHLLKRTVLLYLQIKHQVSGIEGFVQGIKMCYQNIWSSNPTSGYIAKGNEIIISQRDLYFHVHCSIVNNSHYREIQI
jgi:hypothetical protein